MTGTGNTSTGQTHPRIASFTLGPYETNTYVVWIPGITDCWIVDPSFDPRPVIDFVNEKKMKPVAVLLTHAHVDHIAGVSDVVRAFAGGAQAGRLPVIIHEAEREWLSDPMLNLSALSGEGVTAPGPDRLLRDGELVNLGASSWRVIHTPGHSPGGVTFWHEPSNQALVGDTLFAGSVGRTDFPGSDPRELTSSIREKLYRLPDQTVVYPGHGPSTTIAREKRSNPYVRG